MPSTLIVGEVIHTNDLSPYNFAKGGAAKNNSFFGGRGVVGGGGPSGTDVMQYFNIGTISHASDFGELAQAKAWLRATSDGSRGVWLGAGGSQMDYKNILVIGGTATDFGDTSGDLDSPGAASNGTRSVFGGDWPPSNVLQYIKIQNAANAIDYGDLSQARGYISAVTDGNRGVWHAGYSSGESPDQPNVIDYRAIGTLGNAVDFGDSSTDGRYHTGGSSDGSRGVFSGGSLPPGASITIDYITIGHTGDAIDFGDLTQGRNHTDATSNGNRAVQTGGSPSLNTIDYWPIGVLGNATDFGDLFEGATAPGTTSGG